MSSEFDHTDSAGGALALAARPVELAEDDSATTVAEPEASVNGHLRPGHARHLHAYELAMLPSDRGLAVVNGKSS